VIFASVVFVAFFTVCADFAIMAVFADCIDIVIATAANFALKACDASFAVFTGVIFVTDFAV